MVATNVIFNYLSKMVFDVANIIVHILFAQIAGIFKFKNLKN